MSMMRVRKAGITLFCIACCIMQSAYPITLLYSLKIRRIFAGLRTLIGKEDEMLCAFSVVPIISSRNRHFLECASNVDICEKRIFVGSLFDFRCAPSENIWFDVTTGFGNERAKAKGTSDNPLLPVYPEISKTAWDDVTLEAGYHLYPTDQVQLDFYGITGFPTHSKITKKDALGTFVGTRFVGLGAGAELAYDFLEQTNRSGILITQVRYLHFFSRNWDPILPCGGRIQPGDLVDILVAIKYRERSEYFEVGYNPTFFLNEAVILPSEGKVRGEEFVRNGGYIRYSHFFLRKPNPISLGCGFAFNRSPVFNTRVYDGWLSFSIIF